MDLILISITVATAVLFSLNPCSIGIFVMLMTVLVEQKNKRVLFFLGIVYILTVFIVYTISGLGFLSFISSLPSPYIVYITILLSLGIIITGLFHIKDRFGINELIHIPDNILKKVHKYTQRINIFNVFLLGIFTAVAGFPCTNIGYIGVLRLLVPGRVGISLLYILLFNMLFIIPLLYIIVRVGYYNKLASVKQNIGRLSSILKLIVGITLIILGWILLINASNSLFLY